MSIFNEKKISGKIMYGTSSNPLVEAVRQYVLIHHDDNYVGKAIPAQYHHPRKTTHSVSFDYTKILKDAQHDETFPRH